MKCPIDDAELNMTDRQGIEIDYCPKCRGVWLDRGELDKIIERSDVNPVETSRAAEPERPRYQEPQYDNSSHDNRSKYDNRSSHDNDYDERHHGKKHKKEGFLGDLFDF